MRLFIAIEPDSKLKSEIHSHFKNFFESNSNLLRPVPEENLHITLKFLGNFPERKLKELNDRLSSIQYNQFDITLKGIGFFPNEEYIRVIWIGCISQDLPLLAEKIHTGLDYGGQPEFSPHLTIARVRRRLNIEDLRKYQDFEFGSFTAKSFKLIQSRLTRSGPIYTTLADFPLKR